jgi:uncharacterized protein (DUF433 family)
MNADEEKPRREPGLFAVAAIAAYNLLVFDRVTHDPNVLGGRATVRGLRISVSHIVKLVANGMTPAEIIAELPDLEKEDIRQSLEYAAALAEDGLFPIRA